MANSVIHITAEDLDKVKTDQDFFSRVCATKVYCDTKETYNRYIKMCADLHIAAYGDFEKLTIYS